MQLSIRLVDLFISSLSKISKLDQKLSLKMFIGADDTKVTAKDSFNSLDIL